MANWNTAAAKHKKQADAQQKAAVELRKLPEARWGWLWGQNALPGEKEFLTLLSCLRRPCSWLGMLCEEGAAVFSLRADVPGDEEAERFFALDTRPADTQYDLALLNPPFGYHRSPTYGNRLENRIFLETLRALRADGHCTAVMPNGFLGRGAAVQALREELCETWHLTEVLLLPLFVFPDKQVYTSVLRIAKRQEDQEATSLYDLRGCASAHELYAQYASGQPDAVLTRQELWQQEYRLLPQTDTAVEAPPAVQRQRLLREISELERRTLQGSPTEQRTLPPAQRRQLWTLNQRRYELLGWEVSAFLPTVQTKPYTGYQLFRLKNGERTVRDEPDGTFTAYGASGAYGKTARCSMKFAPMIVIGRVGSGCGCIYRAWSRGLLTHNAIGVTDIDERVLPEFLLALLCAARLGRYRRGTGQPYLTQGDILQRTYKVPSLQDQQRFLQANGPLLQSIRAAEHTMEAI